MILVILIFSGAVALYLTARGDPEVLQTIFLGSDLYGAWQMLLMYKDLLSLDNQP